jgi:hypothetical protein
MADTDPIAELRKKFLASLKEAEIRVLPSPWQQRIWAFLRWSYLRPDPERDNVQPIGPADREWLEQALVKLDDLDA